VVCAGLLVWAGAVGCSSGDGSSPASGPDPTSVSADEPSGEGTHPDDDPDGDPDGDDGAATGSAEAPGSEDGGPGTDREAQQVSLLEALPGEAGEGCVRVGDNRDVRSGSVGAGPFDEAVRSYRQQRSDGQPATVRLYFIPATGGEELPGLSLTVENTRTGAEQTVKVTDTADADGWTFYDVQVPVPADGTYEIRAVSGPDSGCFRVRFR
jgi:hypothetical protein